ncbi:hypothetical protein P7C71_g4923, partial [Lecanoromycetidae sp. Uapishka_2]
MDSPNKELSPAPSTSAPSGKGLKGVLKKARLGRRDEVSTVSLNGSDEGVAEQGGIRKSVDSLLDRARDSNRASVDETGLPSGPSNLSKLIPGRVKKKRRKREEAEQQQQLEVADGRGRSLDDQTATAAEPRVQSRNKTGAFFILVNRKFLPSLRRGVTPAPAVSPMRPVAINHPSHIAYLTSSSPLIKTTAIAEGPSNLELDSPTFQNPQYQKSNTLPITPSDPYPNSSLAPQHAATMDARDGGRTLSITDGNRSRGVSPGARIKDVFTIGSRKDNSSPPKSPDRSSMKSGSALGALFNKDKRGSVNLGRSSKALEDTQSMNSNPKSPTGSTRDLPTIVTTPKTPTSAGLEAPQTHVTPPTPTDQRIEPPGSPSLGTKGATSLEKNPNIVTSASGNMISHRRVRSDSATQAPSKLSNVMSAPLTPMIEERRTPGARSPSTASGPGAGGFFSSVFAAAQSGINQLSDTIANNNQTRSRSSTQNTNGDGVSDVNGSTAATSDVEEASPGEDKKLAVETLGTGDLSLSHLGISDSPGANSTTSLLNGIPEKKSPAHREEAAARAEDVSAARAVSQAYSEKPSSENVATPVAEDVGAAPRPRSTYESSIMTGDRTPPNGSVYEGDHGFRRSGSVRSRVGTIAKRHRNSSSATGGTIAAAIASGNQALANPAAAGSTNKLAGFAVATKKRNRDFHQLFRSVPEDDYLIEDYSSALQRDIILAGRMYVSEGHICFSSNILGWVTTLIINYDEIVSIEKESTAVVFPNAIAIQTLHARHTFRSLLSREATYDLLIGIWKINHPSLKSSLNGVRLDQGGTGDKTEKADPSEGDENSEDGTEDDEEDVYDEDEEEDEGTGSFTEVPEGSIAGSDAGTDLQSKAVGRKASAMGVAAGLAAGSVPTPSEAKAGEKAAAASAASVDFPGPIEKGAADGQLTYCNDLVKALKAGVTSRQRASTNGSKIKKGGKRRKGDATPSTKSPSNEKAVPGTQPQGSPWGPFEPLHDILGPVVDIFSPMISPNMVIGFLLFIMLINYLRGPKAGPNNLGYPGLPSSQRIAAYEEIWRREESDLWDWLEQRVGMQSVAYPVPNNDAETLARLKKQRQQSLKGKGFRGKVEGLKMSEREVDHAIRVTEEKLGLLKKALKESQGVEKRLDGQAEGDPERSVEELQ